MARDQRINSFDVPQQPEERFLERWQALSSAERSRFSANNAQPVHAADPEFIEYARVLRMFKLLAKNPFVWEELMRLKGDRSYRFNRTVLWESKRHYRRHVIDSAKAFLEALSPERWGFLSQARDRGFGVVLPVASNFPCLTYWEHQQHFIEGVIFADGVGSALATLAQFDLDWLVDKLSRTSLPLVQQVITETFLVNDPDVALAMIEQPSEIASLGLLEFMKYLRKLEDYAMREINTFDVFSNATLGKDTNQRRARVDREIGQRIENMLTRFNGGPWHDRFLGDLLAWSCGWSKQQRGVMSRAVCKAVARMIAERVTAQPETETVFLDALGHERGYALLAVEYVAQFFDSSETAIRWRRYLIKHLQHRLLVPPAEAFEGPLSSETDPLEPHGHTAELPYITNAAKALAALAALNQIDLNGWFDTAFAAQKPLGNERRWEYAVWLASTSRVGFLLLIGSELLQCLPQSDAVQLGERLARELEYRLPEWEWHDRLTSTTFTDSLEVQAVQLLGKRLPQTLRDRVRRVSSSVWTTAFLFGKHAIPKRHRDAFRAQFEDELLEVGNDFLLGFAQHLLNHLHLYEEVGLVTGRMRQVHDANGSDVSPWRPTWIDLFESICSIYAHKDVQKGIRLLEQIVEVIERSGWHINWNIELYWNACNILRQHQPLDSQRQRFFDNTDRVLVLQRKAQQS
jgi:hypothetical protein